METFKYYKMKSRRLKKKHRNKLGWRKDIQKIERNLIKLRLENSANTIFIITTLLPIRILINA